MKKILMTMVAAFAAVSMQAQVYVGGSFAIEAWSSQKNAGDRSETAFKIMPEIGYNLNDQWAIGTVIGYQNDKFNGINGLSESAFSIAPYARYTFFQTGKVGFFLDGGFSIQAGDSPTQWGVGLRPGVKFAASDKVTFVASFGGLGYKKVEDEYSKFGFNVNGNALQFGCYYSF